MTWFSRLSTQQRLMLIILLPTAFTLLVTSSAFYVHQRAEAIGAVTREMQILAGVTGANCAGAIAFEDPQQAERTLAALKADPAIEAAVLVRQMGPFARYERERGSGSADVLLRAVSPLAPAAVELDAAALTVIQPIEHAGDRIATLGLRCSLAPAFAHLHQVMAASVVVLGLVTLAGLVLTYVLQREVWRPVDELARTMQRVYAAKDYSLRAAKFGEDELGQLTDRFNEVLAAFEANRDALLAAKDAAIAGTQAKSDFLARMSHEIRTPLNAVVGLTGLLSETALTEQQKEYVQLTRSSAEALRELVTDVLDFSKIESGRLVLQPTDFDLVALVEETMLIFAEQLQRKGLGAACGFGAGLPRWVRGDAGRLREVLMNLLSNAIKFTRAGEVTVSMDATAADGKLELYCEVRDTGAGIPNRDLSRLFQPFSQLEGAAAVSQPGTGLGLAICRQLCQLMGGDVDVQSTVGTGTCFRFKVLLEPVLVPPADAAPRLDGRRVLLAAADTRATALLRSTLERAGAQVTAAATLEAARAALTAPGDALVVELP